MAKSKSYTQKVLSLGLYRILVPALCSSGIYRCFCSPDTDAVNLFHCTDFLTVLLKMLF